MSIFSFRSHLLALVATAFFTIVGSAAAQLTLTNNANAQQLANSLAGAGVSVVAGSASLSRANTVQNNTGTFSGGTAGGPGPVVGIASGVVLTTGSLSHSVAGPNNRKNSSVVGGELSDADLTALAGSAARFGTVVLQFNVIPSGHSLNFSFVFGSEEYPEFVCSQFNDALGLFVSGPGISGPFSNAAVNLALLPDGSRVSINTVNSGAVGFQAGPPAAGCNLGNTAHYVDNGDPNNTSLPNPSLFTNTQLDGFTRPLRTRVTVVPGQTYRVKVAIADTADGGFDSAVFLGAITSQADWGDAPESYRTTAASNGPSHDLGSPIFIGATPPDADPNGQPGALANGDDLSGVNDENTFVSFPVLTSSSTSYTLSDIPVTNATGSPAVLAGWIDFNRNGLFDTAERTSVSVPSGTTSVTLHWTGLSALSIGQTYLRLRLSSDPGFVNNPMPTGGAVNGEVEDYTLNIVFAAVVSGRVYHDLQPNTQREPGEDWAAGTTVQVNLVQGSTVIQTLTVNAGAGTYSFSNVVAGSYNIIVTSSATSTTPTPPPGWIFVTTGSRSLSVSSSNIANQDFGLFHGSRIRGTVFRDDGLGGGVANDALQNGGEPGLGGIPVTATDGTSSRTTHTEAGGQYTLFIPAGFGPSLTLSHPLQPATGSNIGGGSINLAASFGDAAARRGISFAAGQLYEDYNFGVVRASSLSPDQSGQSLSPGVVSYAHRFRPGSLGAVSLAASGGSFAYQVRRDANCDGDFADTGEGFQSLPHSFAVDGVWPREVDGSLRACGLEVLVLVPAGQPDGRLDLVQLEASLRWAHNPAAVESRRAVTTTTVVLAGGLRLIKEVRNLTTGSPFATSVQGRPGETLEYRVFFQNTGSQPVFSVVLSDPIPFFTDLVQNAFAPAGEAELRCPDGSLVQIDLGSIQTITFPLAAHCTLAHAPSPSGSGTLPALLPGQGGYFVYRVQVR